MQQIRTVLYMLQFRPPSHRRPALAARRYYASRHRGDDHLSVMDEIRHCFVTVTSKHYNCDGSLDCEPVLTWKRSDIHLLV